jgi:steroid delta-isomerase-like uncharacterized protein
MGEARELMSKMMDAFFRQDYDAAAELYAPDAIAESPELGEMKGRDQIVDYMKQFFMSFPDGRYEQIAGYEDGNHAIDEGVFHGTNTGPIPLPGGGEMPATGKAVSIKGVDVITVENGMIARHNFYYDQMAFMSQLGMMPEIPT